MDPSDVPIKTPKGLDEIRTRQNRLVQKKRNLLILVDGNSSVDIMVARLPSLGDIGQLLQELVDEGYVELKRRAAALVPNSPLPPASTAAPGSGDAVRSLSRMLYDLAGPTSDVFSEKLEAAQNRAAFLQALVSSVAIAESFSGKNKAEVFRHQGMAIADRYFTE